MQKQKRNHKTFDRVLRMAHQAGFRAGMAAAAGRKYKSFEAWYAAFNGTASTHDAGGINALADHVHIVNVGADTFVSERLPSANIVMNSTDMSTPMKTRMAMLHEEASRIANNRSAR